MAIDDSQDLPNPQHDDDEGSDDREWASYNAFLDFINGSLDVEDIEPLGRVAGLMFDFKALPDPPTHGDDLDLPREIEAIFTRLISIDRETDPEAYETWAHQYTGTGDADAVDYMVQLVKRRRLTTPELQLLARFFAGLVFRQAYRRILNDNPPRFIWLRAGVDDLKDDLDRLNVPPFGPGGRFTFGSSSSTPRRNRFNPLNSGDPDEDADSLPGSSSRTFRFSSGSGSSERRSFRHRPPEAHDDDRESDEAKSLADSFFQRLRDRQQAAKTPPKFKRPDKPGLLKRLMTTSDYITGILLIITLFILMMLGVFNLLNFEGRAYQGITRDVTELQERIIVLEYLLEDMEAQLDAVAEGREEANSVDGDSAAPGSGSGDTSAEPAASSP
ncbi:MAG: hypothetical protein ACOCXZ_03620 [Chloroflexota bacterium]